MSQPMVPLNYPSTQAEAQVAQFIDSSQASLLGDGETTVLGTIASTEPGPDDTIEFLGE